MRPRLGGSAIEPVVTWGINPGMSVGVSENIPAPDAEAAKKGKVTKGVRALIVPGSQQVATAAKAEGLQS